jgi:glycosyltransferase involved in cell wall biosynthesis
MGARRTIVCLSSQRWDDGMWTNKQHIMSRLARSHDVYYVSFGTRPLPRVLFERGSVAARLSHVLGPKQRREGHVNVLDFWSPSLARLFRHGTAPRVALEFDLRVRFVARFLERAQIRDAIVWVYHPGYGAVPASLPKRLLVYDCVDEYSAFPEFRGAESWIQGRERELCRAADVVFCTAAPLYEAKREYNAETHLVHNVGDAAHFAQALRPELVVPPDIAGLPRPIVGFVGAVSDYKLNFEWLRELGRQRPSWSIVLIGPAGLSDPNTDVSRLVALPNVHLLGHRPYAELPAYVKGFDVAVIPYRVNAYTRGVFPIKFFEFLGSGRPVVISDLPALAEYWDAVLVARDAEEFVRRCAEALDDTEQLRERRLSLASKHTWDTRVEQLMQHVEAALGARGRA